MQDVIFLILRYRAFENGKLFQPICTVYNKYSYIIFVQNPFIYSTIIIKISRYIDSQLMYVYIELYLNVRSTYFPTDLNWELIFLGFRFIVEEINGFQINNFQFCETSV